MSNTSNNAAYHLVDRGDVLWPVVQCTEDMIPTEEVEMRPSDYHLPVLLLAVFEFKWVLQGELHAFDPSAKERVPNGLHTRQLLREAFDSVTGSVHLPGHPAYPDLGFWRSEIVARDLQNISTSSEESDNVHTFALPRPPRPEKTMPPSAQAAKRPWAKFKVDKKFGEEFGHSRKKVKVKTEGGKNTHYWLPDEDDNDVKPSAGYFENLKKEKQKADLAKEDTSILISDDDTASSEDDEATDSEDDDADETSDMESEEEIEHKPISRPQPPAKRASAESSANASADASANASLRPAAHAQSASSRRSVGSKSPGSQKDQPDSHLEVTQLCKGLDTARTACLWNQAETAANRLIGLAPWSNDSIILIAKATFRVAPRQDIEQNAEDHLRESVAEYVHWNYERLRETRNTMLAMLFRDHEDLAEMVYERRLKALREKKIEVVEISDSE